MVGRTTDYSFLDRMIVDILKESPVPMLALGINFRVNERSGKIIGLNMILKHLEPLVRQRKVFEKNSEKTNIYWAKHIR